MKLPSYDWLKEKTQVVISVFTDSFSQVKKVASIFYKSSSYILNLENFSQFWQGFSRPLDPDIITKLAHGKKTRHVLFSSFFRNLVMYGGIALMYEMVKSFWRRTLPAVEDSYPEKAMDFMAAYYFMCYSYHMLIDNAVYNPCLSKVAPDENPNSEHFPGCPNCGMVAKIQANIASPIYFASNMLAIKLLTTSLPLGRYIAVPLQAQAYGQCLVEYNLGDMCTQHRYELLAKNNAFSFGFGTAFLLTQKLWSMFIYRMTGVDNQYVNDALFAVIFQYFMCLSFFIDKPLPGKKPGKDFFYPNRLVTEFMMKSGSKSIINLLQNPKPEFDFLGMLSSAWHSEMGKCLKKIFLYKDHRSLRKFLQSPAMQLYFIMRGDEIQGFLDWLIKIRRGPFSQESVYYIRYIPNRFIPKNIKKILTVLVDKKLNGYFEDINDLITEARTRTRVLDQDSLNAMRIENAVPANPEIREGTNIVNLPLVVASADALAPPAPPLPPARTRRVVIENYEPRRETDEDLFQGWVNVNGLQNNSMFAARNENSRGAETLTRRRVRR